MFFNKHNNRKNKMMILSMACGSMRLKIRKLQKPEAVDLLINVKSAGHKDAYVRFSGKYIGQE